jgi:FixJ family two-component response regulator
VVRYFTYSFLSRPDKVVSTEPVVYVVDDDPSVSRALERLFRVAGFHPKVFADARTFLSRESLESPSCLVLDVQLPDRNGLDLQKELAERGWNVPIVFITGHGDVPMAVEAMRMGAVHFLPKPFDTRALLAAVRQALELESREVDRQEEARKVAQLVGSLTAREHEVFLLVAAGLPNKVIASRLDVSLQTVKLHRGRLMRKLQSDSVADLVRLAEKAKSLSSGH